MNLTEEQIKEREENPNNLANIIHKIIGKGQHKKQSRGEGNTQKTQEERSLIGLTAHIDTVKNTALAFDCSPASVNAYKQGVTSLNPETRSEEKSQELKELVGTKLHKIHESAVNKLMDCIEEMNIKGNPKAALLFSNIGANISKIVEKTSPNEKTGSGVKVTILSPNTRPLQSFDVIEVSVEN